MRTVCVVGTGYVGLVTGTCLAELGHRVVCVDNDARKVRLLRKHVMPIYEPGLKELVVKNVTAKRLSFSGDLKSAVKSSEVIFIAVGTPPREDGSADMSFVEHVACEIARNMDGYRLIVDKSTVPVETGERVELTIRRNLRKDIPFDVASNPEFLREGAAVHDTFHPDRIVIGVKTKRAELLLKDVYAPITAPVIVTDIKSAEIIKHASNSFLAMKISFINAVANICERTGADIARVAEGMGMDKRIGRAFLNAGIGFGGFCFPKDLEAFYWISKKIGYEFTLLKDVMAVNTAQRALLVKKVEDAVWNLKGKNIAGLGLAFKPDTDDMRFAPSIDIIGALQAAGARVTAYDPQAMARARLVLKDVRYARSSYDAARNADCLLIVTEWDEFKDIDLPRLKKTLKHPIIVDGRNMFEPGKMRKMGFVYKSMGRGE